MWSQAHLLLTRPTGWLCCMMGGEHPFSTTSVARIGKAVAGALRNADSTKNRVLYVHDMVLAQRKVLALARKLQSACRGLD